MEKLRMHSVNKVSENIEKVGELFPNALTEVIRGYKEDGSAIIEQAIDFDVLRQELSDVVVEGPEERYQFTWPDKKRSILLANAPITKTLRPCREESVDFDNTENLYIEGDNLEVLKLLQETYLGKIKMIYIDPPYNTGNDFVYKDDFAQSLGKYRANSGQFDNEGNRLVQNTESNGRFHTDWLNMMYPRLKLAKELLTSDGVIFISINDNEVHNLKKICDEIFGANSFIGELTWESTTQPDNIGKARFGLQKKVEYILFYSRCNKNNLPPFILEPSVTQKKYPHVGKFGRCRFEIIERSYDGAYARPTMRFKILGMSPREGKQWQIGQETAKKLEAEGKLEIVNGIVKRAVYPEDEAREVSYRPLLMSIKKFTTVTTKKLTTPRQFVSLLGFSKQCSVCFP